LSAAAAGSADAVIYDTSAHDKVTFGNGTTAVALSNVADGVANNDAVNVEQLKAMGATFNSSGVATNAFVAYDSPAETSVTLGKGTAGAQIHGLAAGAADTDAVNVAQLNAATANTTAVTLALKYVRFGASSADTANASGSDSTAIGGNAFATGASTLALGLNSRATGTNAVALGAGSVATLDNTVSVGSSFQQRQITNVAAGTALTDAVNLGQVESLISGVSASKPALLGATVRNTGLLGATTQPTADQLILAGPTDKAQSIEALGTDSIAIGLNTHANADQGVAIGSNVAVGGQGDVGIGSNVTVNGVGTTAIGVVASAIGDRALSIGNHTDAETTDGIAIGTNASVGGPNGNTYTNQVAFGTNAFVSGDQSMALGASSSVTGTNTVALGNGIKAAGNNSVVLGAGSDGSLSNVVSVGAKGSERRIVNVAAGTTTTDAVNVGQLNAAIATVTPGTGGDSLVTQSGNAGDVLVAGATGGTHVNFAGTAGARELTGVANGTTASSAATIGQLTPVVAALGGGAGIDAAGNFVKPTYTIQGKKSNDVGTALGDIDGNLTDLKTQITNMTPGDSLVKQDATTGDITVAAATGGNVVDMTGTDGARKITGVAAGSVTATSLDAINGSQLAATSQSVADAIGAGSTVNPATGAISLPSFNVGGTTVHNVGDAITNLDGRVTTNTTNLGNLTTQVNNLSTSVNNFSGGTATPNAVTYDSSAHDVLTLAGTDGTKLTNLQDAVLSDTSTDAVTGKQLNATNAEVASLSDAVKNAAGAGGNAGTAINGTDGTNGMDASNFTPASATGSDAIAQGNGASASGDHTIVIGGGASASNDGAIAIGGNAGANGRDSIAIGNGAQAPADNAVALGAHSVADRDDTVSVGSQGAERQITNVAAGTQGTDAVNLNQLNSATSGIARKAYSGIAAATALTMIPDVDANKTLSIGIGGGTFQGYAATAIGGTARITQNLKVRVGAGWSAAGTTVGAGASYQW
jgi:trimeric autotransporter adhesin